MATTQRIMSGDPYRLEATATVQGGYATVSADLGIFVEGDSEVPKPTADELADALRDYLVTTYPGFQTVNLTKPGGDVITL